MLPCQAAGALAYAKATRSRAGISWKRQPLALTLKILKETAWFLTVPPLLHPKKRNPSPANTVVPLHIVFLQMLWGRAANSENTWGICAGYSIYRNTAVSPRCQPLVPMVLPAGEGAAVAEHGLFPYKQHRLGPCRAMLCV